VNRQWFLLADRQKRGRAKTGEERAEIYITILPLAFVAAFFFYR